MSEQLTWRKLPFRGDYRRLETWALEDAKTGAHVALLDISDDELEWTIYQPNTWTALHKGSEIFQPVDYDEQEAEDERMIAATKAKIEEMAAPIVLRHRIGWKTK